jgi:hypothetical protein
MFLPRRPGDELIQPASPAALAGRAVSSDLPGKVLGSRDVSARAVCQRLDRTQETWAPSQFSQV